YPELLEDLIAEEDSPSEIESEPEIETSVSEKSGEVSSSDDIEKVLNSGMEFLSGLMKMATGKDSGLKDGKVEVNKETGEVVMKFKLPGI
ncbi:MAG: hypothetical protein WBF83_00030, partial [Moheibacter sp.]